MAGFRAWSKGVLRSRVGAAIAASAATILVIGAAVRASIPDGGVIHACYLRNGGLVRLIDPSATACTELESALSWNQTGPQGPPGQTQPQHLIIFSGQGGSCDTGDPAWYRATGGSGNSNLCALPRSLIQSIRLDPADFAPGTEFRLEAVSDLRWGLSTCIRLFDLEAGQPVPGSTVCQADETGEGTYRLTSGAMQLGHGARTYAVESSALPDGSRNPPYDARIVVSRP